jgi:hypothetical protein
MSTQPHSNVHAVQVSAETEHALRDFVCAAVSHLSEALKDRVPEWEVDSQWERGSDGHFREHTKRTKQLWPIVRDEWLRSLPDYDTCVERLKSDEVIGPHLDRLVGVAACKQRHPNPQTRAVFGSHWVPTDEPANPHSPPMSPHSMPTARKQPVEPIFAANSLQALLARNARVSTALSVRRKRPFSPVIYVRKTAYKANHRRPDKWVTLFFSDGYALPILYAVNVGPWCCLRAGGNQSELIGRECGFAAPHICSDCGLKTDVVCEPE